MEAPAVLYHYTSLDTLAMILHNRTIRFSRLDKVDDPQEQRSADSQNLGKMKLVSCWTSSDEESIPMWREYAGAECGVRIQMKSYPFKQYSVSNDSLNMLSSEAVLKALGGSFDGLHLPLETFGIRITIFLKRLVIVRFFTRLNTQMMSLFCFQR